MYIISCDCDCDIKCNNIIVVHNLGPVSMTTDSPESTSDDVFAGNLLLIVIILIVVVIVMMVLLVAVCATSRWMLKKKHDMNPAMIRANNMSMSTAGHKSHSPPPFRSESPSNYCSEKSQSPPDYCSEMSGDTHTTQLMSII